MWGFFDAGDARTPDPVLDAHVGPLPVVGALFRGPPIGAGCWDLGHRAVDHDHPLHLLGDARGVPTVPSRLKESAYALGCHQVEVSWDIVLPYTRSAVIEAACSGSRRARRDHGGRLRDRQQRLFNASLLEPSTTIAALIANDFGEATEQYRSALLLLGFVLFIVTFVVLALARLMLLNLSRKEGNR